MILRRKLQSSAWSVFTCTVLLAAGLVWAPGCSSDAPDGEDGAAAAREEADQETEESEGEDALVSQDTSDEEPEPQPPGEAPFDTTFLHADTEFFVYAKVGDILDSSLVQTLSAGNLGPLDEFRREMGFHPRDIDSLTLGASNLAALAETGLVKVRPVGGIDADFNPGPRFGGELDDYEAEMMREEDFEADEEMDDDYSDEDYSDEDYGDEEMDDGGSGSDPIRSEDAVVAVLRLKNPLDMEVLEKEGVARITHGDKSFYRQQNDPQSPCAYLHDGTTLVIGSEKTIRNVIEKGLEKPRPTADLGFVKTAPHLMVAVVPRDMKALLEQRDKLPIPQMPPMGGPQGGQTSPGGPFPGTTPGASGTFDSRSMAPQMQGGADPAAGSPSGPGSFGSGSVMAGMPPGAAGGSAPAASETPLEERAEAFVLLVDLSSGIGLDVAVKFDTDESAQQARQDTEAALDEIRTSFETAKANLPGMLSRMVQPLVDSLEASTADSVITISTKLPEEQQANLAMLPMLMMGMMMSSTMEGGMEEMTIPREFTEQILHEGQSATNADELPDGVEVHGLTRWGDSLYGDEAPPPLELGVVATGGPAGEAVAVGKVTVNEARVGETSLKWSGVATESFDTDLVSGFETIDRTDMFTEHPQDGVIARFHLVAPGPDAAGSLTTVAGQLTLQVPAGTEEVLVKDLRRGAIEHERLQAAGFSVQLSQGQLDVSYVPSPQIGSFEPVTADGNPVATAGTSWSSVNDRMTSSYTFAGPVPDDLALKVTTYSDLQEVVIPFRFEGLPLPEPPELSETQQALMVWTRGETPEEHPDLIVEAQGRWRELEPQLDLNVEVDRGRFGSQEFQMELDDESYGDDSEFDEEEMERTFRDQFSGRPGFGNSSEPARRQQGPSSEEPLRIVIDLIGPLAQAAEALGEVEISSVKTDIDTELPFEGVDFGSGFGNAAADFVEIDRDSNFGVENPPNGLRVVVKLTPPNQPIGGIAQLNGSLKLRTVRERTEAILSNLQSRVGKPEGDAQMAAKQINDRELLKFGLKPVVAIEPTRVRMRLIEGKDERISDVTVLDLNGVPIADVIATAQEGSGQARGRMVYTFEFPGGVPQKLGMKISVNMGVNDIEIPIRIRDMPLPPMPAEAG